MPIDYDDGDTLQAAAALVNSLTPRDSLSTITDLERFIDAHDYTGRLDRDSEELAAVRGVRARLRTLLTVDRETAADILNPALIEYSAVPQLTRHGARDWHFHVADPSAPLAHRIVADTAVAVARTVIADELGRIGSCAASECEHLVIDLTRNRSRRFCSVTCANRMAAAAYRARQKQDQGRENGPVFPRIA